MNHEDIIAKLQKLMALAERGEGGEAVNARAMMNAIMRRHGITDDDMQSDAKRKLTYITGDCEGVQLLAVVISYVLHITFDRINASGMIITRNNESASVWMTAEQHAVVAALYEHHKAGLARSYAAERTSHDNALDQIRDDIATVKRTAKRALDDLSNKRTHQHKIHRQCVANMLSAYVNKNKLVDFCGLKNADEKTSSKINAAKAHAERAGAPNQLAATALPGPTRGQSQQSTFWE